MAARTRLGLASNGQQDAELSASADLLARVEAADGPDGMLDRQVAFALGYRERKVTSLGLNGRTPGRYVWFKPHPESNQRVALPRFTGPRKRAETIRLLKALLGPEPAEPQSGNARQLGTPKAYRDEQK